MTHGTLPPERPPSRSARSRGRPSLAEAAIIDAQLLEAAFREFCRHGYGGTSMRNIAREANVSRTTLAARFATKAELFYAIMRWQSEQIGMFASLQPDQPADLTAGLVAAGRAFMAGCTEGVLADLFRLVMEGAVQFPEIAEQVIEIDRQVVERFATFITRCAEEDGIPCRDPRRVAQTVQLTLRGWSMRYIIHGAVERPEDCGVEQAIEALIAGRAGW